ncbi:hypothetical protein PFISCL1PPCAC_1616, partial [Pristionchus fissidentatus]
DFVYLENRENVKIFVVSHCFLPMDRNFFYFERTFLSFLLFLPLLLRCSTTRSTIGLLLLFSVVQLSDQIVNLPVRFRVLVDGIPSTSVLGASQLPGPSIIRSDCSWHRIQGFLFLSLSNFLRLFLRLLMLLIVVVFPIRVDFCECRVFILFHRRSFPNLQFLLIQFKLSRFLRFLQFLLLFLFFFLLFFLRSRSFRFALVLTIRLNLNLILLFFLLLL